MTAPDRRPRHFLEGGLMLLDCIGYECGVIMRYVERSATVGVILLAFGQLVVSKESLGRRMRFALVWLLVIMVASGLARDLLCKGKTLWTIDLAINSILSTTIFVLACVATYRQISKSKRTAGPGSKAYSLKGAFESALRLIRRRRAGGAGGWPRSR